MRKLVLSTLVFLLTACATGRNEAPRQYLDEQTAATITVVRQPWIFSRQDAATDRRYRGFLHLYAIDVNRMGHHEQYLAALVSEVALASPELAPPRLELKLADQVLLLDEVNAEPRTLGIAQPIDNTYTLGDRWWYFPVDKETLATIANARELDAALVTVRGRFAYTLWSDGRAALAELTAVLP